MYKLNLSQKLEKITSYPNSIVNPCADIYETIYCLERTSVSILWKILKFDENYVIETHKSLDDKIRYDTKIDRAKYGEDFAYYTNKNFHKYTKLKDNRIDGKVLGSNFGNYFGTVNTESKILYRTETKDIKSFRTYDILKKIREYNNGFLIDILTNYKRFLTGFYVMELMNDDIISDFIDIRCDFNERKLLKSYLIEKCSGIEICYNCFYVNSLDHLIKLGNSQIEVSPFSFENVIIKIDSGELKIYDNIPVHYNFLTTNTCYIKEIYYSEKTYNKYHLLRNLSILHKNKVNILLTNGTIKLLSNIFAEDNYPECKFNYKKLCKEYQKHPEFINILKTELLLYFPKLETI